MEKFLSLMRSEMEPALGCTEPVAVALAVSRTCCLFKERPTHINVKLSSNIFKNAYCVRIPGAEKSGIRLSAALGCLLSSPDNDMELFSRVDKELVERAEELITQGFVTIEVFEGSGFYIEVAAENDKENAITKTVGSHSNIVRSVYCGAVVYDKTVSDKEGSSGEFDITAFTIADIVACCAGAGTEDIVFLRQAVEMNLKVSEEGLKEPYGLEIGRKIRQLVDNGTLQDDIVNYVKMVAAAACDYRMGGGSMAVMTVLGSGNQGIQAILPVAAVAQYKGLPEETMLRGVMMSILLSIFIKYQIGRLSPICGSVLAGAGVSGAICWMLGGTNEHVGGAMQNMLGNLSGMICDGAKDSCALKIATCSGEAVLSAMLAINESIIQQTDGIVCKSVEDTIKNVSILSGQGMAAVDKSIISLMLSKK